jgi:hypothetical protein
VLQLQDMANVNFFAFVWRQMRPSRTRSDIRRRLAAGQTPTFIAEALGVAKSTVYRVRKSQGRLAGEAVADGVVSARLSSREMDGLDRLVAAGVGRTRGAVMRKLIRAGVGVYQPTPEEEAFLLGAERHLSRLGGNFNQIAAALSASVRKIGRAEPTREQVAMMHAAADEVGEIREVLAGMLRNAQVRVGVLEDALVEAEREARAGQGGGHGAGV